MITLSHIGGRKHTCPSCCDGVAPRHCQFFNADKSYTKYAFRCGYVEYKGNKSLIMEHGVFHVYDSYSPPGMWTTFDNLTAARKFLRTH